MLPPDLEMRDLQLTGFGRLLRQWRQVRRVSQLELALGADVSARHVSFIETGRSSPSREMVLTLAGALALPFRERNRLLQAAGYAPAYRETSLNDPEMGEMLRALKLILRQYGPIGGAVAFDRHWDVIMANASYARFMRHFLGDLHGTPEPFTVTSPPRPNLLRLLFDPAGFRRYIVNWEIVARSTLARVRQEAAWSQDPVTQELLETALGYPGVPARWKRNAGLDMNVALVTPVELRLPQGAVRLFSTVTTLGTPLDITLQELRIESFHAVDEDSKAIVRALLGGP